MMSPRRALTTFAASLIRNIEDMMPLSPRRFSHVPALACTARFWLGCAIVAMTAE
jgi:hypothetical protein